MGSDGEMIELSVRRRVMRSERIIIVLLTVLVGLQVVGLLKTPPAPGANAPVPNQAATRIRDVPENTVVDVAGMPIEGTAAAKVVVIEFSDYECPFCARHATQVLSALRSEYVVPGKIQYAFANHPLPIHPNAVMLATAAMCAGEQDKYWAMHDTIFKGEPKTREATLALAQGVVQDFALFERCMSADVENSQLLRDRQTVSALQVTGTPTFALGSRLKSGKISIRKLIVGSQAYDVFRRSIDDLIAELG